MDALIQIGDDQIVAEIIEAVFIVRAVGDVGAIGFGPRAGPEVLQSPVGGVIGRIEDEGGVMLNDAGREAEGMVELTHPLRVPLGQIIVHGNEMRAFSFEGVQIDREGGDESLSLAGFHLGDAAFVQNHAADQLDIEMAHVELAPGHLPADGEGLGENVVESFTGGQSLLELLGLVRQGLVGEGREA